MRSCLQVLLLLALSATSLAGVPPAWEDPATRLNLSADPEWLALGHYAPRRLLPGYRSYADDPRFFLSPDGPTDPAGELTATLAAFVNDPASQCRFVARRSWLAGRLPGLAAALPPVACPEYDEWRRIISADALVLVFAASYLNSPSSMYGHTFLRFDSRKPDQASPLLSYALNFGANIPADENGLLYAYRGLAGGYPGQFAAAPYFDKIKEYSRLENRDLWEYRLNLSGAELDRLLEHIWELQNIRFDYYFFDENCSFRLLELLDVARPGANLTRQFPYAAIPIDTVRVVRDAGLVAGVEYRPANLTIVQYQIGLLNPSEQRLAKRLASDPALRDSPGFLELTPARQYAVAEVAYGYLRYTGVGERRNPELADRGIQLLKLLNTLSVPAAASDPPQPVRPDDGHDTALLSIAAGSRQNTAFADLEWRASYHDLLDDPAGYPRDASLNMARVIVRDYVAGGLQLQRLDLVEITSLAPRNLFLKPLSWSVDAGWERQQTAGHDVLVTQVHGGAGWSAQVGGNLLLSGLVTGRVEYNHEMDRSLDFAPGVRASAFLGTGLGRTALGVEYYHFTGGVDRTVWLLAHDLPVRRNLSLRVGFEYRTTDAAEDDVSEGSLGLRWYF